MGGRHGFTPESMEDNLKTQSAVENENKEVALGICFGTGLGIVAGALLGNVPLGLSAGGVLGIVAGVFVSYYKKIKK